MAPDLPDADDERPVPLSPDDEARVRALLAEVRATDPMPADVAARLEDAVVGLAAERRTTEPVPADNVVPLTRSRRHRVVTVLGAAAAVAVVGLGLGAVLDNDQPGVDASSDNAVERGAGTDDRGAVEAEPSQSGVEADNPGISARVYADDAPPFAVRPRHLTRDLAYIQDLVLPAPATGDYASTLPYVPRHFDCRLPHTGPGVLVGVRYDGRPAFVRFREPTGDSQVVEVLQCGTGDLLRSTTLPSQG